MCEKVKNRIECLKCGYPYSEALYPDNELNPLSCDATEKEIIQHLREFGVLKEL